MGSMTPWPGSPVTGEPAGPGRAGPGEELSAGLFQRAASAFAACVPADPADDGFFGPASVTWRLHSDLSVPVSGLRSLLLFSRGGGASQVVLAGAAFVVMGALLMYFRTVRARWVEARRDDSRAR